MHQYTGVNMGTPATQYTQTRTHTHIHHNTHTP